MSTPPLSFDRAHFEGDPPPADACAFCHRGLVGEYYRVGSHLACSTCAANAQALVPPDSHKAFVRAVLFGVAASVVGCIAYAVFGIVTGITLGYAAIGVGYIIGWSMKKGSRGLGGRRYQVIAAILTYAAVAVAFVPMAMHEINVHKRQPTAALTTGQQSEADAAQTAHGGAATATGKTTEQAHASFSTFFLGILLLLGLGLISPFLLIAASVFQGAINLFILYIAMQFAWRFTAGAKVEVQGPFASAQ